MVNRPIEESHHVIVACPRTIVEHHQPMPWTDESYPSADVAAQRHLLSQVLGKSTFCLVRDVKTGATARQRQRRHKAVPIAVLETILQPARWVGNAAPCIHQDRNVADRGLRRIIEWHVEPRRQMTSRSYVADKMVENHKLATLTGLDAAVWGRPFTCLWAGEPHSGDHGTSRVYAGAGSLHYARHRRSVGHPATALTQTSNPPPLEPDSVT